MTPPRRRGRRIPPKGTGLRPIPPPPDGSGSGGSSAGGADASGAGGTGAGGTAGAGMSPAEASAERARQLTRAQNRAAKRAASGVRPKAVRGGRVTGRRSRGYNPAILALAIAAVRVGAVVFLIGNPFGGATPSASPGGSATPLPTRVLTGCPTSAPSGMEAGVKRSVTIQTPKGDIVIDVEANLAPVAAANFVALASCGYYDGVIFHRVVPDFVIQGGDGQYGWIGGLDRSKVGQGGPGYEFNDEPINGDYTRGTVAMANSGVNTNGSQFFICTADLASLPKSYTIFGHVTSDMDVVDQIVAAPRDARDLPNDPVAMTHVTVSSATTPSAAPTGTAPASPASTGAAPTASQ